MSKKRAAASELNHTNWDEEEEVEESGTFRTASKDELQRREFRTARRRKQPGDASQAQSSIFSAFSGFANKPAPTSFDFLSNLTNGTGAASNGSSTKKEAASTVSLFGSPPIASSTTIITNSMKSDGAKSGLFGITSSNNTKTTLGKLTETQSVGFSFGSKQSSTAVDSKPSSVFGVSSPDMTTTSKPLFCIPSSPTSASSGCVPTSMFAAASKSSSASLNTPSPGPMFGIPSKTSTGSSNTVVMNIEKKSDSVFGITSNSSTPMPAFKLPTASTSNSIFNSGKTNAFDSTTVKNVSDGGKEVSSTTDSKTQYYSKLKGLNESVSEWIRKHVDENPLCLLTPIFKDYEKYLKELEDELKVSENTTSIDKAKVTEIKTVNAVTLSANISSVFSSNTAASSTQSTGFSLTSTTASSTPFSFGSKTSTALGATTSAPASAPFSFGIGAPFTFNANSTQKPPEQSEEKKDDEDEDAPPKVDFTPLAEENSVFDKRCKIFFKKDGNFVDKGVGTLYIKTVENSSKYQLIVRANTSLGTVLLNFILSESIPVQRMGKNNVMMVCIPTPDAKPPPVPVLIRVKTAEEADDMLETLNKYKK